MTSVQVCNFLLTGQDQLIEDFLKQMENIIRECPEVRCCRGLLLFIYLQAVQRMNTCPYSSSSLRIVKITPPRSLPGYFILLLCNLTFQVFSILIILFSDRNAISSYVTHMESQNLNSVLWDDTFFSTVYKCRLDPTLAELSFQLIYYMIYKYIRLHLLILILICSKGCVFCFRNDNLLPRIICNAEGVDESITITPTLQKIASSILEKVVLEGGQTALQYCSNMELFMLLNSSNYIARMGALVMMADLCHWSVQPVHFLIEDCQDVFKYECSFQLEDGEEVEGIAMCLVCRKQPVCFYGLNRIGLCVFIPLPFIFVTVLLIDRIRNFFTSTAVIAMTSCIFTVVLVSITCSTPTPLPEENILAVCIFLGEKQSTYIFPCIFGIPFLHVEQFICNNG